MEQMKLNKEKLQKILTVIKKDMETAIDELSAIDINSIDLYDLIHYKSRIKETISLSYDMYLLKELSENFFIANESKEAMGQIKERMGTFNDVSFTVIDHNTSEIEKSIKKINLALESKPYKNIKIKYLMLNNGDDLNE